MNEIVVIYPTEVKVPPPDWPMPKGVAPELRNSVWATSEVNEKAPVSVEHCTRGV